MKPQLANRRKWHQDRENGTKQLTFGFGSNSYWFVFFGLCVLSKKNTQILLKFQLPAHSIPSTI